MKHNPHSLAEVTRADPLAYRHRLAGLCPACSWQLAYAKLRRASVTLCAVCARGLLKAQQVL